MSDLHPFLKPAVTEVAGNSSLNIAALVDYLDQLKQQLDAAVTELRLARGVADNALAATQTQAATLTDHAQKLTEKLPLTGGTLTGPLNVMAPATASNPLQLSSLPLSMTVQQALPLIALGTTYSFTVAVANAVVGQVVVLNMQQTLLDALTSFTATVTAAGTVTIKLKAGIALAAATQTFYLRVLR